MLYLLRCVIRSASRTILPVVPYPDDQVDTILDTMARREHPLALYLFTGDRKWANQIMRTQQYGGRQENLKMKLLRLFEK